LDDVRLSRTKVTASFGATYASIYDALYWDKNYAAEVRFVLDQLRTVLPRAPRHILDLGCGTGLHAIQMAQQGISVTGIDHSANMVAVAKKHKKAQPHDARQRLHFEIGDIRSLYLHHQYDAVISLFHVISYLIENNDLRTTIQTARRHLISGGALLFDFWYGPAVLRDPPQPRVKEIQIGDGYVRRRASPELDHKRHRVYVNYDIEIKNATSGEIVREQEQHVVRYFFPDEVEDYLVASGFEVVRVGEMLTRRPPSDSTFSVYALAKVK